LTFRPLTFLTVDFALDLIILMNLLFTLYFLMKYDSDAQLDFSATLNRLNVREQMN